MASKRVEEALKQVRLTEAAYEQARKWEDAAQSALDAARQVRYEAHAQANDAGRELIKAARESDA